MARGGTFDLKTAALKTAACTMAVLAGALALVAAKPPAALSLAMPGMWEFAGQGSHVPTRECVADLAVLARFEHRANSCNVTLIKDAANATVADYTCAGAGFGHSEIEVVTPRSLRISTQGISGGMPFNYVLQARRVGDCAKPAPLVRH
jgi:hypothetical protein